MSVACVLKFNKLFFDGSGVSIFFSDNTIHQLRDRIFNQRNFVSFYFFQCLVCNEIRSVRWIKKKMFRLKLPQRYIRSLVTNDIHRRGNFSFSFL